MPTLTHELDRWATHRKTCGQCKRRIPYITGNGGRVMICSLRMEGVQKDERACKHWKGKS